MEQLKNELITVKAESFREQTRIGELQQEILGLKNRLDMMDAARSAHHTDDRAPPQPIKAKKEKKEIQAEEINKKRKNEAPLQLPGPRSRSALYGERVRLTHRKILSSF
jgi:hypothetical protein